MSMLDHAVLKRMKPLATNTGSTPIVSHHSATKVSSSSTSLHYHIIIAPRVCSVPYFFSSDFRPGVGKAEILQANFSLANVTPFQPLLWCLHGVGNSYQDLYGLTCNLEVHACIRHGREKIQDAGSMSFVFFLL